MIKRIFDIPSRIFLEFHKELNNLWNPTHQKSKSNLTCFLPFLSKDWLLSSRGDAEKKKKGSQKGYQNSNSNKPVSGSFFISRDTKFKKKGKKNAKSAKSSFYLQCNYYSTKKKKRMNYCNFNLRNTININLCTRIKTIKRNTNNGSIVNITTTFMQLL